MSAEYGWRADRIGSALRGENPTVLARMPGGFAVIGDVQWLPGYCVLLSDRPDVSGLSELPRTERRQFLESMDALGAAVAEVCAAADPGFRRINLEILGNDDEFLHAHVWPRYEWELPEIVRKPVWLYPQTHWSDPAHALGLEHDALRAALTRRLTTGDRRPDEC